MSCEKSAIKGCPAVIAVDDCKKGPSCVPVCNDPCPFNHVPSCCNYGCKDNCMKVAYYNNPCTKFWNSLPPCCDYGCKGNCKKAACDNPCGNPCTYTPPCCDYGCKGNCKKAACNNPCGNPCTYTPPCCDYGCKGTFTPPCCDYDCQLGSFKDVKDDCKGTSPCASKVTGCFPDIKLDAGDSKEAFCKPVCERNILASCHDQDIKNVVIKNVSGCDCKGMQPCGHKMIGRFPAVKLDSEGPCYEPTHAFRN